MTNIVAFPTAKSSTWKRLEDDLHASSDPKGILNVHAEVSKIGRLLPSLACDPLTISAHEQGISVAPASTFTGAAALCSRVVVHDLPTLNDLGCVADGHMLWVPQNYVREILRKSQEDVVAWMQEGVSLCANMALGRDFQSTHWNAVTTERMRVLLQDMPDVLEHWAPDPTQDRARYQSALNYCGVEQHSIKQHNIEQQWNSGDANVVWGEILNTLETTRNHQQWTNQRVAMKGVTEIGKLLAQLANELEGSLLKRTIWTTLSHVCPAMDHQQLKSIFSAVVDNTFADSDVNTVMDALVSWQVACDLYQEHGTVRALDANHSETCREILNRVWYAQWKDQPTPSNQLMALATATRHEEECSNEALKLCGRINFSSQDIVDLAHAAPQLLLEALKSSNPHPTSDIFKVVADNVLKSWDHSKNCAQFANTLIALIDKGWATHSTDLDPKYMWEGTNEQMDRGLSWVGVVEELAFQDECENSKALATQWPRLIDAALKHNPKFATQALWLLCEHNDIPSVVYETLINKGADLHAVVAFGPTEAVLGEAVLRKTDSLPLKALIRRQLSDEKFGATNVVGITRKFE